MRMYSSLSFLFLGIFLTFGLSETVFGQIPEFDNRRVVNYTFDSCSVDTSNRIRDVRLASQDGLVIGNKLCSDCGRENSSFRFDGMTTIQTGESSRNRIRDDQVFTISFLMRPDRDGGRYEVFSRSDNCGRDSLMLASYDSRSRVFQFTMRDLNANFVMLEHRLPEDKCWNHIAITRRTETVTLFVNGEQVDEEQSVSTIFLRTHEWEIGRGQCSLSQPDLVPYKGLIDEFRIYAEYLSPAVIRRLAEGTRVNYLEDNQVSLAPGDMVGYTPVLNTTCIEEFRWEPTAGVDNPTIAEPTILPSSTQTYTIFMTDRGGCVTTDSLNIRIPDIGDFDCEQLTIPNAFTPNGDGPMENETFGIHPNSIAVISSLTTFQIFDRRGNLLWATKDILDQWDGTFEGSDMPVGTYLVKIRYLCGDSPITYTGTVYLMR